MKEQGVLPNINLECFGGPTTGSLNNVGRSTMVGQHCSATSAKRLPSHRGIREEKVKAAKKKGASGNNSRSRQPERRSKGEQAIL